MATDDEERYLRASLLLLKGTLFIVRKVLAREEQKEINDSGRDLDDVLQVHKGKLEHEFKNQSQRQKLFPVNRKTNVEDWDISLLTGVLLIVFRKSLSDDEKRALKYIKYQRNEEFAHRAKVEMPLDDFKDVTDDLTFAFDTLAFDFDSEIREECKSIKESCLKGPLDIRSHIERIRRVSDTDDMFSKILDRIEKTDENTTNNVKTLLKDEHTSLKKDISEQIAATTTEICKHIENKQLTKSDLTAALKDALSQLSHEEKCFRTVKVVESELEISGTVDDKVKIDLSEQILTTVINEAIARNKKTTPDLSDIRRIVQQILNEISSKTGVRPLEAFISCIVIKFECASYEQLWKLLLFLESDEMKQRLSTLAVLICRHLGVDEQLRLSISLSSRTLQSIIDDLDSKTEYKRSVKIPIQLDTAEGMAHVLNLFEGGGLTNSLNKLKESLSAKVGTKLNLKSSVNVYQLNEALEDLGVSMGNKQEQIDKPEATESKHEKNVQDASEGDSPGIDTEKISKQRDESEAKKNIQAPKELRLGVRTEKKEEEIDKSKQSESRSEKNVQNAFEGYATVVETEKTLTQKNQCDEEALIEQTFEELPLGVETEKTLTQKNQCDEEALIKQTFEELPLAGFETTNIAFRPELSYKSRSMDDIIDVSKDYLTDLEEKDVHEEKSKIQEKHWTGKETWLKRSEQQKGEIKHGLGPLFAGFDLENQTEIFIYVSTPWYPKVYHQMIDIEVMHMFEQLSKKYPFRGFQIGVCAPTGFKQEQYSDYGCLVVDLDDFTWRFDYIGGRRFKVVSRGQTEGYNTANVKFIHDKPPADLKELKELSHSIYSVCKSWYDSLAIVYETNLRDTFGNFPRPESDDNFGEDGPAWHWWMVAALPIPAEDKVTMQASESYKQRLLMLKKAIGYYTPSLKRESMSARLETGVEKQLTKLTEVYKEPVAVTSYVAKKNPIETPTKLEREIDFSTAVVDNEDFVAVINVSPAACPREVDSFCEILREAGFRLEIFTEMSYKTKGTIIKAKRILVFISCSFAHDIYVEMGQLRERITYVLFYGAVVNDIPPSLRMCPVYYYPDDALAATHHLLADVTVVTSSTYDRKLQSGVGVTLSTTEGSITHPDKTKLQSIEKFLTEEIEGLTKEENQTDEWNKGQQHENLIQSIARLELVNKEFEIPVLVHTLSYPGVWRKVRIPPEFGFDIYDNLFKLRSKSRAYNVGACSQIKEHLSSYGCIIADMKEWPFSWIERVHKTKGGRRFKVLHREKREGFDFARVRFIRDMQPADLKEVKELSTEVYSLCRHWYLSLPCTHQFHLFHTFGEFPIQDDIDDFGEDGTVWHWWMLAALPMLTEEKVSVLGMESYKERLLKIKIGVGQYKPSLVKADMHELMETSVTLPVTPVEKH